MRIFVGGNPVVVPARWFFVDDNPVWKGPHGCESQPWLKQYERNDAWGEITEPHHTWDRGDNPGYIGQCYVGQHQWFLDGQLPADILTLPPLPYPQCCRTPPVSGPILLSGEVTALGLPSPPGPAVSGSGGSAGSSGPTSAVGLVVGPIQLGGVVVGVYVGDATGPIQLAGEVTALQVLPGQASGSSAASAGSAAPAVGLVVGPILLGGVVTVLQVAPGLASGSSAGSAGTAGSGPTSGPTSGPMSSSPAPSGCTFCPNGAAAQFQVVVAGVTNGAGCVDCVANINGTFRLLFASGCTWSDTTLLTTFCGSRFSLQLIVSSVNVVLDFYSGATLKTIYRASRGAWDCMSPLTLSLVAAAGCATWPATLTIVPV